jgi:hypothetical protein
MTITAPRKRMALLLLLPALLIILAGMPARGEFSAKATSFPSPEDAVDSLVAAVREGNNKRLMAILGPGSREIVTSGDPVADKAGRKRFVTLYDEKHVIEGRDTGTAALSIGNEDYPFPIPLVRKDDGTWQFDTRAGKEEILNRRIGRNELEVIDVLRAYVGESQEVTMRAASISLRRSLSPATWGVRERNSAKPWWIPLRPRSSSASARVPLPSGPIDIFLHRRAPNPLPRRTLR